MQLNDLYGGAEGLCQRLHVDPIRGLDKNEQETLKRQGLYGANIIPKGKAKSFLRLAYNAVWVSNNFI